MGTGVIVNGKRELVPGLSVANWLDNPILRLRKGEDFRERRTPWIRQIILHTTKGIPGGGDDREQDIRSGFGPPADAGERCARWWSKSAAPAGAHLVVDHDGKIFCCVDLETEAAQHAKHANQTSIGVEIYQGSSADLYMGQLENVVLLCDWLTKRFGIQRQVPDRYIGPLPRLMANMDDVIGVLGHRDLDRSRGRGDPGSKIFYLLHGAGYEDLDYGVSEDRDVWRRRQRELAVQADGIPGPRTMTALRGLGAAEAQRLRVTGYRQGLWVRRPGDEDDAPTV